MDFYTNITLAALIVTAIGVFLGPLLAERNKKLNERRSSHFNKIKNECLKPIIGSITDLMWNHFTLQENIYDYQGSLHNKEFLGSGLTDIKLWYSITINASNVDRTLNKLLYDDLKTHFPKLKENIDDVQKFLDSQCYDYETKRNELVIKIFSILEPKIKSVSEPTPNNQTGLAVGAALFYILNYDKSFWPNYYSVTSTNGTLKIIREMVESQEEIRILGNAIKETHDKAKSKLSQLRNDLEKIMDYERELKGKCSYI